MKKVFVLFSIFASVFLLPFFVLAEQIDINSATLSQLDKIVHVGIKTAQKIIDARPYSSVQDLSKVKGIGDGKYLQDIIDQGFACVNCQTEISQIPSPTATVSIPTPSPSPQINYPFVVFINEVLPSPEGADEENEWIELFNNNDFEVDLSSWKIEDKQGKITSYVFPEGTKITSYLVLKRGETKIILNNDKDGLSLIDPNGNIKDSIDYEKSPKGKSYSRIGDNWVWNKDITPGTQNIQKQIVKENSQPKKDYIKEETISIGEKAPNKTILFIIPLLAIAAGIIFIVFKKKTSI